MYKVFFCIGSDRCVVGEFPEINDAMQYVVAMARKAKAFGAFLIVEYKED